MLEYDLVFITNIPAFYKINLYNEIAKKKKIFVIFISKYSNHRNLDFYKGDKNFDYEFLNEDFYEERKSLRNILKLYKILRKLTYQRVIIGGWDSLENWIVWLMTIKTKNSLAIESSEFESTTKGYKGFLKKVFLQRISLVFASGEAQINLIKKLNYQGKIKKTKGVGIFNYKQKKLNFKNIEKINKFLFVGRLSEEKNVKNLILIFNEFPELTLSIIGDGPLKESLKKMANKNILFYGNIDNEKLNDIYQEHHVFILPSKLEPWGLVVEEALYNGLPVILSNQVGCSTEVIKHNIHGYIYNINSNEELIEKIETISYIENFKYLKENVLKLDFKKIREKQIEQYL